MKRKIKMKTPISQLLALFLLTYKVTQSEIKGARGRL